MTAPKRGNTGYGTYFITASTAGKRHLFQSDRMAMLFVEVLFHYRDRKEYLLHEFVLMPNHFHLLLTPTVSLGSALQLIKGGFSYRAKNELGFAGEIWETSFYDHRIRDFGEYKRTRAYVHQNPVRNGLASAAEKYPYCSAAGFVLDEVPQRLKPLVMSG